VFLFVKDGDLFSWFTTFSEAKASAAPIFLRNSSHFNLFPYWQHRWFIQKYLKKLHYSMYSTSLPPLSTGKRIKIKMPIYYSTRTAGSEQFFSANVET
jgi:hypothetical protein